MDEGFTKIDPEAREVTISRIKPKTTDERPIVVREGGKEVKMEAITEKTTKKRVKLKLGWKLGMKGKRALIGVGIGSGIIAVLLIIFLVLPGLAVYRQGMKLKDSASELKASVNSQDINIVENELKAFSEELDRFDKSYNRLAWVKVLPWVGGYWKDGRAGLNAGKYGIETAEIVIETVKPYADIIGFAGGESAKSGEESANDRIEFLVQTITEVLPKMDAISEKANLANSELAKIDTSKYPEKFRGMELRSNLENLISLANEGTAFVADSKPLMEVAPYLLGMDDTRTYMLIFQNDKELRPTGGFITAYSIMDVRNGKMEPVASSDIYHLDDNYVPQIEAPRPMVDYLKGIYKMSPNFRLRDMNWSPDYKVAMDMFSEEIKEAGVTDIDGIIAVDTYVVVYLLDVLGQIGVPGFGNFSTEIDERCNCPQVIYELESFADVEGPIVWSENDPDLIVFAPANYDNRKKIVGPLMNSVIRNALGQEKERLPDLFMAGWKMIMEKHLLVYMFDENAQRGVESFNIAGRIEGYDGDYLHISDANLGGRKSNLYVTQEVAQKVEMAKDGSVTKTLTITYKNPQEYDGWLNSVLPNWTRVYVPDGSELIDSEGFEDVGETYTELGKTVFSGGFELRPQGVKKIVLTYKLPFKVDKNYNLLIQKQPGTDAPLYSIEIGKKSEEFYLRGDREVEIKI